MLDFKKINETCGYRSATEWPAIFAMLATIHGIHVVLGITAVY